MNNYLKTLVSPCSGVRGSPRPVPAACSPETSAVRDTGGAQQSFVLPRARICDGYTFPRQLRVLSIGKSGFRFPIVRQNPSGKRTSDFVSYCEIRNPDFEIEIRISQSKAPSNSVTNACNKITKTWNRTRQHDYNVLRNLMFVYSIEKSGVTMHLLPVQMEKPAMCTAKRSAQWSLFWLRRAQLFPIPNQKRGRHNGYIWRTSEISYLFFVSTRILKHMLSDFMTGSWIGTLPRMFIEGEWWRSCETPQTFSHRLTPTVTFSSALLNTQ